MGEVRTKKVRARLGQHGKEGLSVGLPAESAFLGRTETLFRGLRIDAPDHRLVESQRMTTALKSTDIYNVIIGTAGHIDHGKSTLVKRLTGIDPDRLPEEKEREMTIDLGFAPFVLKNGQRVGIID